MQNPSPTEAGMTGKQRYEARRAAKRARDEEVLGKRSSYERESADDLELVLTLGERIAEALERIAVAVEKPGPVKVTK